MLALKRFFQAEKVLYIQVFQNESDHRMLISWIVFFWIIMYIDKINSWLFLDNIMYVQAEQIKWHYYAHENPCCIWIASKCWITYLIFIRTLLAMPKIMINLASSLILVGKLMNCPGPFCWFVFKWYMPHKQRNEKTLRIGAHRIQNLNF